MTRLPKRRSAYGIWSYSCRCMASRSRTFGNSWFTSSEIESNSKALGPPSLHGSLRMFRQQPCWVLPALATKVNSLKSMHKSSRPNHPTLWATHGPHIGWTRSGRPLMSILECQPPLAATAVPDRILPPHAALRNHPILTHQTSCPGLQNTNEHPSISRSSWWQPAITPAWRRRTWPGTWSKACFMFSVAGSLSSKRFALQISCRLL